MAKQSFKYQSSSFVSMKLWGKTFISWHPFSSSQAFTENAKRRKYKCRTGHGWIGCYLFMLDENETALTYVERNYLQFWDDSPLQTFGIKREYFSCFGWDGHFIFIDVNP